MLQGGIGGVVVNCKSISAVQNEKKNNNNK